MSDGYRNSRKTRSAYDDQYYARTRSSTNESARSRRNSGNRRRKRKQRVSFLDYLSDFVYQLFKAMPWNKPKKKKRSAQSRAKGAELPPAGEKEITIMRFSRQDERVRRSDSAERIRRKKRRKRMRRIRAYCIRLVLVLLLALIVVGIVRVVNRPKEAPPEPEPVVENRILPAYVKDAYLDINPYSRPGTDLLSWKGIVVHETDEVISAEELTRQWNQRKVDSVGHAPSHFIIDTNGEIRCCIPIDEVSYASDDRSVDTISITLCRQSDEDPMNELVRDSLDKIIRWICGYTGISYDNVLRHYDVSGRTCPKVFVNENSQWEAFLAGLHGIAVETEPVETEAETVPPTTAAAVDSAVVDDDDDSVELGLAGEDYGDIGDDEIVDDIAEDE